MIVKALCWLAAGLLLAPSPSANVAGTTLQQLADNAHTIVLAKVERVEKMKGHRWASARTLKLIKGPARERVVFLAEPTWRCDISDAAVGEEILLFLEPAASAEWNFRKRPAALPEQAFVIVWSGRGRMPVRQISGEPYVTVWSDVRLPQTVKTRPGPEPKKAFIRSARLADVLVALHAPSDD